MCLELGEPSAEAPVNPLRRSCHGALAMAPRRCVLVAAPAAEPQLSSAKVAQEVRSAPARNSLVLMARAARGAPLEKSQVLSTRVGRGVRFQSSGRKMATVTRKIAREVRCHGSSSRIAVFTTRSAAAKS